MNVFAQAFIAAYFDGLVPWRNGSRRLLLLASEDAFDGAGLTKRKKQSVSLLVLTRCLNLSEQVRCCDRP